MQRLIPYGFTILEEWNRGKWCENLIDIEGSDSEDDQNKPDEKSPQNDNLRLQSAMARARQAESALQQALADIEEMRWSLIQLKSENNTP